MANIVYLEAYSSQEDYLKSSQIKLPLASFITYSVFKYCSPEDVTLNFVYVNQNIDETTIILQSKDKINLMDAESIPWQAAACVYPVVIHKDTAITGLCAVARHISKYRSSKQSENEHEEGLLGFRKSCLQAPNEVSIWTKFCEIDIIKTVKQVWNSEELHTIPQNLMRFENHLRKPVRVHNVYKIAREIKKENSKGNKESSPIINDNNLVELKTVDNTKELKTNESEDVVDKPRVAKTRKWKSKAKKELEINSSTKIEDLEISHQFAEGPFFTLADLLLLPSYHILLKTLREKVFETYLPLTLKWYNNIINISEINSLMKLLNGLEYKSLLIKDLKVPLTEDVSLYKCDPKRHNPKKRLFTKEVDIENALSTLLEGMELNISENEMNDGIDWKNIPDGANPSAGHLPDERMARKSQQLENLALAVVKIAKDGDLIVDFCSGSGHLGILLAHLLPKCTVVLLENKEQSLLRARERVHNMGLKNVYFFQCNLDFFIGKFDIGIALHACGIASDLVLDKCLKANAKFVLCPCCYGSLHATDRLVYPRSNMFKEVNIDQYLCIGHAADQTHDDHPLTIRGGRCMAVIDSDRARLAEEYGYKVTLYRLKPLSCTPKNNLLIGVPS